MDHRGGKLKRRDANSVTLQAKIAMKLIESFDMIQTVGTASDVGGISTSSSEDSEMAQYSRRRRTKGPEKKALHFVGFGMFDQCLTSHGFTDSANNFPDIVKMTKDILLPVLRQADIDTHHQPQEETTGMEEENVEIGEEDILFRDYDLERV